MKIVEYNFRGNKFKAVEGDNIGKHIANNKYYDSKGLNFSRKFINNSSTVLDVGANIGNHTLYYLRECKCHYAYAFEPHNFMFSLLEHNLQNYSNKTLYNVGISDREHNVRATKINPKHVGSTILIYDNDGKLKVRPLDAYDFDCVDFIKIDVEGYENEVLLGALDTITAHKPVIATEVREHKAKSAGDNNIILNETASIVHKTFKSLNYKHIKTQRFGATQEFWEPK